MKLAPLYRAGTYKRNAREREREREPGRDVVEKAQQLYIPESRTRGRG